ncbi:MAG: hypothetical protein AOA65_0195 [Candidatus Bathyarchaeota archaeon BA1]|nr:MAG: hypothetical protein AOA65_0195 [Candidatus Bathyarchaeota archaeon BA1]
MVAEGDRGESLAETGFLFGLRRGDRQHDAVMKILEICIKGLLKVQVLSSAVVEAKAVLYSRGLKPREVEEACSLMDVQLIGAGIEEYTPLTLADATLAERLRSQYPKLTFFDALHVATARKLGKPLLSNDPAHLEAGAAAIKFKKLIEEFPT